MTLRRLGNDLTRVLIVSTSEGFPSCFSGLSRGCSLELKPKIPCTVSLPHQGANSLKHTCLCSTYDNSHACNGPLKIEQSGLSCFSGKCRGSNCRSSGPSKNVQVEQCLQGETFCAVKISLDHQGNQFQNIFFMFLYIS